MRSILLRTSAILLFAIGFAATAELTWTGGGGAGVTDWSMPINWGGDTPAAGDALIFPLSATSKTATNGTYPATTAFGPLTIDGPGYVLSGASSITLQGGLFLNGANTAQVAMPIVLDSTVAITVSHASGALTLSQPITGTGGIIKSGSGLLITNGNNSYSGPTIIAAGGIQVGDSIDGLVQISSGSLVGIGTVQGVTSLNQGVATIAPGTASLNGTLTSNGAVKLYANDLLRFDVTNAVSDRLTVNGTVDLGLAGIVINVVSAPSLNTDVVLIENDGTDPVTYDAANPSNYFYNVSGYPNYRVIMVGGTNRNDMVLRRVATTLSTVSLTSSNLSVTHGTSVTFTATVTGSVSGSTVTFWDGNEFLGSNNLSMAGQAQISTTTLKTGQRKITAFFEGNGTNAPARSAIITQTVTGTDTVTGLVVSPAGSSAANALVTMTATVTGGSPSGTVTFLDNGVALGTETVSSNQAVFTTTTLTAGVHSLKATYNPTGAYEGSTSNTVAHTVTGNDTTTTLVSSANPAVAGSDVTFTATVANGTLNGSVMFRDGAATLGTVPLSGGVAELTTSGLSAGTHAITAYYLGSTEDEPSNSTPVLSQVITAAPDGSGSSGGNDVELSGGCGLGSGTAALLFGLLMLLGLRLRRS